MGAGARHSAPRPAALNPVVGDAPWRPIFATRETGPVLECERALQDPARRKPEQLASANDGVAAARGEAGCDQQVAPVELLPQVLLSDEADTRFSAA